MNVKKISVYFNTDISSEEVHIFLNNIGFIQKNAQCFQFKYRNVKINITQHKYKKNDLDTYVIEFESILPSLEYYSYHLLCTNFFNKLPNFTFIEMEVTFYSSIEPDKIIKNLMSRKFRKPYESLQTLIFNDYKKNTQLTFLFAEENLSGLYKYQLFINSKSNINLDAFNKYVTRMVKVLNSK